MVAERKKTTPEIKGNWISKAKAAKRLDVDPKTIDRMIRARSLSSTKPHGKVLVSEGEIDDMIADNLVPRKVEEEKAR